MKYLIAGLILCGVFLTTRLYTQPPQKFSYQGVLTNSSGQPIPDGTYSLTFKLYTVEAGGTAIWTETHSDVSVSKGVFGVILGSVTPLTGVNFAQQLYLGVSKGSDAEFAPRSALTSAPSSLAPWAQISTSISYIGGNVGIGTTNPGYKLHVNGAAEGISMQGTSGTASNMAYMTFRNSAGTRIGYVGDGSTVDDNVFLSSDNGDVTLNTLAGRTLTATSSGNVGIGTTSPNKRLTVAGSMEIGTGHGNYEHLRIGGGNSSGFLYGSFPRFGDGIHLGYNYYADASGNNKIIHPDGGTSRISMGYGSIALAVRPPFFGEPIDKLTVTPTEVSVNGQLSVRSGYIRGWNADFENGQVRIGNPSGWSICAGCFDLEVTGAAAKTGGGSWSSLSDIRLKKDVQPLSGSLDQLLALRGVTFEYVDPKTIGEFSGTRIGMIAQDVEKVFPDWVEELKNGYKSLTYRGFEALTVEALRDLRTEKDIQIQALQQEIEQLKMMVKSLASEKKHDGAKDIGEWK